MYYNSTKLPVYDNNLLRFGNNNLHFITIILEIIFWFTLNKKLTYISGQLDCALCRNNDPTRLGNGAKCVNTMAIPHQGHLWQLQDTHSLLHIILLPVRSIFGHLYMINRMVPQWNQIVFTPVSSNIGPHGNMYVKLNVIISFPCLHHYDLVSVTYLCHFDLVSVPCLYHFDLVFVPCLYIPLIRVLPRF